jgi:hypothetical protein
VKRRYPIILALMSAALCAVAAGSVLGLGQVYQQLVPYYTTTEYVRRDDGVMYQLLQLSSALYELTPWAVLAAIVPLIAALALTMARWGRRAPARNLSVEPLEHRPPA